MAPEYGATCGIFPIDGESLNYLRLSEPFEDQIRLVEAYARAQGLWRTEVEASTQRHAAPGHGTVLPRWPARSARRTALLLSDMKKNFNTNSSAWSPTARPKTTTQAHGRRRRRPAAGRAPAAKPDAETDRRTSAAATGRRSVVIAAITSCTNTSNPAVMLAAGWSRATRSQWPEGRPG
jgi:aconitate hydratase